MIIRRNIMFALKKRTYKGKKITENLPIRMRITYNSKRLDFMTGFFINETDWDIKLQRVKKNTVGKNGQTATTINSYLNKAAYEIDEVFKAFELLDRFPEPAEVLDSFRTRMNEKHPGTPHKTDTKFWVVFEQFIIVESAKNSWQPTTVQKFKTLGNHIKLWKAQPRFDDFSDKGLTSFLVSMIEKEDLSNATILKQLDYLKWFLRWAHKNHYNSNIAYEDYSPHLKLTKKKIIFLTIDEIRKLISYEIPKEKSYLDRVRDVFVFCCFTGLRHSDVYNLKRSDILGDKISIITVKTADSIVIEFNDVSQRILDKYNDIDFPKGKALPVISNQKMNAYLKELCELAGFDEEIRITSYYGNERIDKVYRKYELIGTHQGRKSFICNCLAAGIPVNVVMKWTGHSDYQAMKPYIDVADTIKAREMNKLNNLL